MTEPIKEEPDWHEWAKLIQQAQELEQLYFGDNLKILGRAALLLIGIVFIFYWPGIPILRNNVGATLCVILIVLFNWMAARTVTFVSGLDRPYKLMPSVTFSPLVEAVTSIILILAAYTACYSIYGVKFANGSITHDFRHCAYFSVVTWTSTGFGDIIPAGNRSHLIAVAEMLNGYVGLAFIFKALEFVLRRSHGPA